MVQISRPTPAGAPTAFLPRIVNSAAFQRIVLGAILVSGALAGLETHAGIVARYGPLLRVLEGIVLTIFVLEIACKVGAHGARPWRYFRDPWNVFDFVIVAVCLLPVQVEHAAVLRLVRVLRVLRLITAVPRLQMLVAALLRSLPSMSYVALLLAVLFYVYAVLGVSSFRQTDPAHFGSLGAAALTLFQVVTLEGWVDVMRIQLEAGKSVAPTVLYFVSFILLGTMVTLNLLIGVIVNGMDEARQKMEDDQRARHLANEGESRTEDDVVALRRRVADFDGALADLQRRLHEQRGALVAKPEPCELAKQ